MIKKILTRLGLLRRKSLAFASGPVKVSLKARVASPNTVTSPMTGMRAAIIELVAGERRFEDDPDRDRKIEVFLPLGSMVIGDGLLLETDDGLLEVPAAGVTLVFPGVQNLAVTNVDRPLPAELEHVMDMLREGTACFREHTLSQGDPVTLTGVVEPKQAGASPFRAYGAAWVARPDLGAVTIRDESLADFW